MRISQVWIDEYRNARVARADAAEAELALERAKVERLRGVLKIARAMVLYWAQFADERQGLRDHLAQIDAELNGGDDD